MESEFTIAIVCPEYKTDVGGQGGLSTSVDFLVALADERGWKTQIFAPRMYSKAPESRRLLKPSSWTRRIQLHRRSDGVVTVGSHIAELEPVRYLPRRVLDRELDRFDVVVIISGSPAAAEIARRLHRPVVLAAASLIHVERAQLLATGRGPKHLVTVTMTAVVETMDRRALRIPAHVLVLNPWMRDQCLQQGARAVTVAPPGIDTNYFHPGPSYAATGPMVMVARLGDARKDYPTLFRAYARARARGLEAPLIVAGRGQLSAQDTAVLESLDIASVVQIRSDLSSDELLALLQSASLFLMSSAEEGLGLSIVEGMACGLPVVSTATEGAQYVLASSTAGEVVPVGNPEALSDAILTWMSDPDRREAASTEARGHAVTRFSMRAAGDLMAEVIENAAHEPGPVS